MSRITFGSLALLAGATLVLWVVPSMGTQGMGTIGQRIVHADAALFDTDPAVRDTSSAGLTRADGEVEAAAGL